MAGQPTCAYFTSQLRNVPGCWRTMSRASARHWPEQEGRRGWLLERNGGGCCRQRRRRLGLCSARPRHCDALLVSLRGDTDHNSAAAGRPAHAPSLNGPSPWPGSSEKGRPPLPIILSTVLDRQEGLQACLLQLVGLSSGSTWSRVSSARYTLHGRLLGRDEGVSSASGPQTPPAALLRRGQCTAPLGSLVLSDVQLSTISRSTSTIQRR